MEPQRLYIWRGAAGKKCLRRTRQADQTDGGGGPLVTRRTCGARPCRSGPGPAKSSVLSVTMREVDVAQHLRCRPGPCIRHARKSYLRHASSSGSCRGRARRVDVAHGDLHAQNAGIRAVAHCTGFPYRCRRAGSRPGPEPGRRVARPARTISIPPMDLNTLPLQHHAPTHHTVVSVAKGRAGGQSRTAVAAAGRGTVRTIVMRAVSSMTSSSRTSVDLVVTLR